MVRCRGNDKGESGDTYVGRTILEMVDVAFEQSLALLLGGNGLVGGLLGEQLAHLAGQTISAPIRLDAG
jgi:hypothetical protein